MASCLYECLCEAELDKYYPNFTALGFQKIDELAKVSMKDYTKMGVHSMKDRKQLFQLIKIIKILQAEEEEAAKKTKQRFHAGAVYFQAHVTRPGPRRQLHFDSLSDKREEGKEPETGLCRLSSCFARKDKDDLATVLGDDSECKRHQKDSIDAPATWTECKLDFPTTTLSSNIAPLLGDTDAPVVQRVAHISGYNYGVPHSCVRPNTAEKEMPWTETDKIRVCVRKRPLGLREERRGEVNIITVEDKETLLLHEKKEAVDLTQYILQHVFYFDEVFGEGCSNQDVYMKTAHPLIQHIFNGGNATCFAYGQTGAGKTYTMIGSHQNPGLYALAAKDIFRHLETSQAGKDLHVWISFYEIYCGQLYDLLNGRKRLFAREDSKHVVQIVGLREVRVETVNLLLEVILKGGKERSTGATGVNSDSSRSHAIIQIQMKDSASRVFGRISFIDLAGSERAADARDSDRQTKMEGAEINQSLLALKECIRALDQEHAHTPFRQSKLTQVLKDSFIGNSKTCMIANISPSHIATEHTLNTLRYADRVKELKKGMRCYAPAMNRQRATGSMSPKRIQNSPCAQAGDKSSPKKVKLGSPSPLAATSSAPMKTSPLLFHLRNPPFSSTPRGAARKGHPGTAWLGQPSPPKGALGAGLPAKKTSQDVLPPPGHGCLDLGLPPPGSTREGRQADRQRVRSRKVQPVRKQLVSRATFSLGDARCPPARVPDGRRAFAEQCAAAWTSVPPQPEDREQHLRLYHQQFQQPPILQEKLAYQPLGRLLAQHKAQEERKQPQPPTSPQGPDETMQLEDLDDSDFSEDSFSTGPSRRRPEAASAQEGSPRSFFLHRRESGGADGREVQIGQELFFELLASKEGASPGTEGAGSCEESPESRSDWSPEEAFLLDASLQNDTPEKPYCSQEHSVACSRRDPREFPVGQKLLRCVGRGLGCSEESCSGPEKETRNASFTQASGAAGSPVRGQREDSIKGCAGGLGDGLLKGSDLPGPLGFSLPFSAGTRIPWTVSPLDAERAEAAAEDDPDHGRGKTPCGEERDRKDPLSPRMPAEEDPRLFRTNKASPVQPVSPPAKWLPQFGHSPKILSSLGDASPLSETRGCVCGFSAGEAGLAEVFSPWKGKEGPLLLGHLQGGEEAALTASLSHPGPLQLGEEDPSEPRMLLKHTEGCVSRASGEQEPSGESLPLQPISEGLRLELGRSQEPFEPAVSSEETRFLKDKNASKAAVQKSSKATKLDSGMNIKSPQSPLRDTDKSLLRCKEVSGRQFVIQIHQEQLDEMASLSLREEGLIRQMSELDLEDFVAKLDGILLLKSQCLQRTRAQLQPLLVTAERTARP
ncbi:kinesin-like protein KIF24 isoform X2 [Paroedura picta]